MTDEFNVKKHTLFLENRETLTLSGIIDVESFNEDEVTASSDWGDITVKGSSLRVDSLDTQTGEMKISGKIGAVIYSERVIKKGWLKRVLSQ